jgi:signal transduction histidine kinase
VNLAFATIRGRLTLWYVGLLAATLAICGAVLYVSLYGGLSLANPLQLLTMHASTPSPGAQEDALRASVGHLLGGSVLVVPLILVLAVSGGLFLAGRALDPIDRMIRTANRIGAERTLHQRLGVAHTSDELGRLATTLDDMLDRLEAAFRRERQLTVDIAHELRTPLAAMILQAEVALGQRRPAGDLRLALQSLHGDATRLACLVDQMLQLARAEAGQEPLTFEPLELTELAAEILNSLRPLATARGVELAQVASPEVWVRGDQARLTQVLSAGLVNRVDTIGLYLGTFALVLIGVQLMLGLWLRDPRRRNRPRLRRVHLITMWLIVLGAAGHIAVIWSGAATSVRGAPLIVR